MNRLRSYLYLILSLLVGAMLVYWTFTSFVEFSGFAAGLMKAAIGVTLFVVFDRWVMKDVDTLGELKAGNIAYGIFVLSVALIISATVATAQPEQSQKCDIDVAVDNTPAHLDTALAYQGTVEYQDNTGPTIDRFLASVGLGAGNPYCAAFVSYALDAARPEPERPDVRSGLATHFITDRSIKAKNVLRGTANVPPGSIPVWRKGNTIYGHTGIVIEWRGGQGTTIEANTSAGTYGSQRDGDGIWKRDRSIQPGNYFRITHFTKVIYNG